MDHTFHAHRQHTHRAGKQAALSERGVLPVWEARTPQGAMHGDTQSAWMPSVVIGVSECGHRQGGEAEGRYTRRGNMVLDEDERVTSEAGPKWEDQNKCAFPCQKRDKCAPSLPLLFLGSQRFRFTLYCSSPFWWKWSSKACAESCAHF